MNDSSAKEINERKPQRPFGCLGIFFHLFHQNRRFAKKLFPKKLLSPDKLGARPGGSDKEDMDFEMAEIKSSKPEEKVLAESVDSVDDEPLFP
ncbi:hypothetical protein CQW23_30862 [Capsicum baccatum]|uniref:Uncharacterized protein n=1 Tax=Capsicum baccatum TaxID=33114 RepID=A0A2G2V969_CAPBA|nr:hypothetical protein CQW23_30862 [Capsicum baccatum]